MNSAFRRAAIRLAAVLAAAWAIAGITLQPSFAASPDCFAYSYLEAPVQVSDSPKGSGQRSGPASSDRLHPSTRA